MTEKMDWYCRNCHGEGDIEYPFKGEESALVICQHCQHQSAYYWCIKCGMGGQISKEDPSSLSTGWTCVSCNSEYPFDIGFHDRIISFTPIAFGSPKPSNIEDSTVRRWEKIRLLFIGGIFLSLIVIIIDIYHIKLPDILTSLATLFFLISPIIVIILGLLIKNRIRSSNSTK